MVFFLWIVAGNRLAGRRYFVEHYYYWYTDWPSMFQVCFPCFLPFWKRSSIWRQYVIPNCQCLMAAYKRHPFGVISINKWITLMLYNYWYSFWTTMLQNRKISIDAFWCNYSTKLIINLMMSIH